MISAQILEWTFVFEWVRIWCCAFQTRNGIFNDILLKLGWILCCSLQTRCSQLWGRYLLSDCSGQPSRCGKTPVFTLCWWMSSMCARVFVSDASWWLCRVCGVLSLHLVGALLQRRCCTFNPQGFCAGQTAVIRR